LNLAAAIQTGEPGRIRNALRAFWQNGTPALAPDAGSADPAMTYPRILEQDALTMRQAAEVYKFTSEPDFSRLLRGHGESGENGRFFAMLAEQQFAADEFEDYLRAVDEPDRDRVHLLYADLAQAYRHRCACRCGAMGPSICWRCPQLNCPEPI
jgi:hypothetical protein